MVFSLIKGAEKFGERSLKNKASTCRMEREFGERQKGEQFPVPQMDGDLQATKPSSLVEACSAGRDVGRKVRIAKRGRSVLAHEKIFVSNRTGLMFKRSRNGLSGLGLSNRLGLRRFGKGEIKKQFPVPQTGSESRAVKHAERRSVSQTGYKNKLTDLPRLLAFVFKKVLNALIEGDGKLISDDDGSLRRS